MPRLLSRDATTSWRTGNSRTGKGKKIMSNFMDGYVDVATRLKLGV
jgi:hypothetical protein